MENLYLSEAGFSATSDPVAVAAWLRTKAAEGRPYRFIFDDADIPVDLSEGEVDFAAQCEFASAEADGTQGIKLHALPSDKSYGFVNSGGRFETSAGFRLKTSFSEQYLRDRATFANIFLFRKSFVLRGHMTGSLFADQDLNKSMEESMGIGVNLAKFDSGRSFNDSGFELFDFACFWRGLHSVNGDTAKRRNLFVRNGQFRNFGKSAVVINMPGAKNAGEQTRIVEFSNLLVHSPALDVSATVALGSSSCSSAAYENILLTGRHAVSISFEETDGVSVKNVKGSIRHQYSQRTQAVLHVKSNNASTLGGTHMPNTDLKIRDISVQQTDPSASQHVSNGLMIGGGTAGKPHWVGGGIDSYKFTGFNYAVRDFSTVGLDQFTLGSGF